MNDSLTTKFQVWSLLRDLKKDYLKEYTGYYEPTETGFMDSFDRWLVKECGIKIHFDYQGAIKGHVDIVDEAKYAWVLLKYK